MSKLLKSVSIILGSVLLVAIIAVMLLVTFVSPDRFKPLLVQEVKKYTGRELVLDGKLSWSFFPYLGVSVGHASLGNPEGFSQKLFAEFSDAKVSVRLLPLLSGRVESSGVTVRGMKLNLIKQANGNTNWVFPQRNTNDLTETATANQKIAASSAGLAISAIDVVDAEINWDDETKKQTATIKNFNFHASNISLTRPVPIAMDFDFVVKNPMLSGHASLTSQAAFNFTKQIYSLRSLDLVAQTHKNDQKINLHVTGDLLMDMVQQTLQWTNFKANVADLNLVGKVNVLQLTSAPQASGHFDIEPFDLKSLLKDLGQDSDKLQVAKDVDGSVDFSASANSVKATGVIKVDQVQAAKVKLNKINARLQYQDGVLDLAPITANLYQGNLVAQSKIQLRTSVPQIQLQGNLSQVQIGPLLADMGGANQKLKLTGVANVNLQVTTMGSDADTIIRNLNGTSKLSLNNGVVEGLDIGYYIDSAAAIAQMQKPQIKDTSQTTFGTLTATAVIQNGVVSNNDLLLDSPRFDTKGKGTINLVNKQIDYSLQAVVKQTQISTVKNLAGIAIPMRVSGSLENPRISLDTDAIVKALAQQQIEKHKVQIEKVQEQIQDKVKEKAQEQAGKLLNNLLGN